MRNITYIIGIFLTLAVFVSCEEEKYEFGDIITPTNVQLSAAIVGQDINDPELMYGDGEGFVKFEASADNALNYVFEFGDGKKLVTTSGTYEHRYTVTGVNTFVVTVNAIGTAGVSSTETIEVTVYSAFSDVEAEDFLAGEAIGDSKTWYWAADIPKHVGLGPVFDDYGNGEFAYEAWWGAIQPWDAEKYCMYNNEFLFTRTEEGLTFEQTQGPAFIPGTYAGELGVDGDTCHDETVATTMFGEKTVSFIPSESKAALEGLYDGEPYRGTSFEISDGGFMGWYVGSSTYDIIYIDEDKLIVRTIQPGDGFAWYHVFTSTKPVEGGAEFTDLVWQDEFDTDGAPDATKWTYDLGAGGWGNGEAQTYTNDAENVVVSDGTLKITAKDDGNGGYTSARIKTQDLYNFTYGRVEVRAKLPAEQGTWPAIWMLGSNFPTVGWPESGEIDIMEQTGNDKETILGTVHWLDASTNAQASFGDNTSVPTSTTDFHVYALEWTEDKITMFVDDVNYYEFDNNANLPFNSDFFMILNVAMGGTLGGTIDANFTEATMEVDYVRVYQ